MAVDLSKLLQLVIDKRASELQLAESLSPSIRLQGELRELNLPALDSREVLGYLKITAPRPQAVEFEKQASCEYGYPFRERHFFLVNHSTLGGKRSIRFRLVPKKLPDAREHE
jgi:twitching motility protein PilT